MHDVLAERVRGELDPETTLRLTGARSKQRKATSSSGADAPLGSTPEYQAFAPIFDWTEESVMQMLAAYQVPLWEGYARGFARTCCWCCPGQRPAVYAAMRREHPELFSAFVYLEELLGSDLWQPACAKTGSVVGAADKGDELLARRGG
jgi:3'-phosphoadenosine 5'-phosphosulfate sulfotransferase (PAPS reductase)/FAD synthetase